MRLLRITTVPVSLQVLLRGQLQYAAQNGYEVLAVSAPGAQAEELRKEGIAHRAVRLTRKIQPLTDLLALLQLIFIMIRFKPHIVHTHTPKAGLLGMLAAWICRVPVRLHTVAGLPLMEAVGLKKNILYLTECLTYSCAHRVYPNSFGLLAYLEHHFNVFYRKFKVIGSGSSNGIDVNFFHATPLLKANSRKLRETYGIPGHATVIGFVGRIVKDKGVHELTGAFQQVLGIHPDCWLMLVGEAEPDLDPLDKKVEAFLKNHPRVIMPGFQKDVRPWMLAMDVLVLPSYREGFPNVVMQAACLEIPCVVSDITGCNELIAQRKTGLIVPPANEKALAGALLELISNRGAAKEYAHAAREYVIKHFEQQTFWQALLGEYHQQMAAARCRTAYTCYIKPFFDRLAALIMLAATVPLWLLVIPLLALQNKGKVFFLADAARPERKTLLPLEI
ncbi:MAG: hypothetical protein KatS3mg032_0014 [Cyclobacteriaceae bacterium]|nr:MAG: hypothetical protein KatS3mg032_0014 [Cyclobacteriaceae bacterium]